MESDAINKVKEPNKLYTAYDNFEELDKPSFKKIVMPLIKAYYKHEHGEFVVLNYKEVETEYEIYVQVYVDRKIAKLEFYLNPHEWTDALTCDLKFDKQKISKKDIFNFLYYEYHGLFFDYNEQKYLKESGKSDLPNKPKQKPYL